MATIAITGVTGGIGSAVRAHMEAAGHRVIGVDRRDAEVVCDLSTSGGRRTMARDIEELCDGQLDGLVVASGSGDLDGARAVSVDYFGAVAALEGLRPLLQVASTSSVVVLGAAAVTSVPDYPIVVAEWCLAGDEEQARKLAAEDGPGAWLAAKLALSLWVRRAAAGEDWIGAGIRMNIVAPGHVDPPAALSDSHIAWERPMPLGRSASVEEVAGVVSFMLSPQAGYICGVVLPVDGGTEAALRPDAWPRPPGH